MTDTRTVFMLGGPGHGKFVRIKLRSYSVNVLPRGGKLEPNNTYKRRKDLEPDDQPVEVWVCESLEFTEAQRLEMVDKVLHYASTQSY